MISHPINEVHHFATVRAILWSDNDLRLWLRVVPLNPNRFMSHPEIHRAWTYAASYFDVQMSRLTPLSISPSGAVAQVVYKPHDL